MSKENMLLHLLLIPKAEVICKNEINEKQK